MAARARPGSLAIAEELKGFDGITATAGGLGFATQWDGGFQLSIDTEVAATKPDMAAVQTAPPKRL